jgi:hypothetical protein
VNTHNESGTTHKWPKDGDHMWDRWHNQGKRIVDIGNGKTAMRHFQSRSCLHPDCHAWQDREAPNA